MNHTITITDAIRDELESLCAGYALGFALLKEEVGSGSGSLDFPPSPAVAPR